MKKGIFLPLISIFVIACTAIIIIVSDYEAEKSITDREIHTVGYQYTVKEYKGKIAVFDYGAATPVEILDCPLSSLPADEANKLKAGINVSTQTELQQLIEAYD